MRDNNADVTIYSSLSATYFPREVEDYSEILNFFGLKYKIVDFYLQVGEIEKVQGWILHLSAVKSQIIELFECIIPLLIKENVSFKIAQNQKISHELLDGNLGQINLGKIICIYPNSNQEALALAKELIHVTRKIKGPDILTDKNINGIVYTRYGSFNPILKLDAKGQVKKYIYNILGEEVLDDYSIPFRLAEGIVWPFNEITDLKVDKKKRLMNDLIKPIYEIKSDVKGRVIKGIFLKNLFQVKSCIVKEGKKNMFSDVHGRDIQDRLEWQYKLHKVLQDRFPLPRIIDKYKENGNDYLVMEFIKGNIVDHKIQLLYAGQSWNAISKRNRLLLIKILIQTIQLIGDLHKEGFVHRDITPFNFIIASKNKLYMIDLELAYSKKMNFPNPPFMLGSDGFLSPEQQVGKTPTEKEDIYAIGSLMIVFVTGLLPSKFSASQPDELKKDLIFFTGDEVLSDIIVNCQNPEPSLRPSLPSILEAIQAFNNRILRKETNINFSDIAKIETSKIEEVIYQGTKGLTSSVMTNEVGVWFSKTNLLNQFSGNELQNISIYCGIYEGISGPLYLIAQFKKAGFIITDEIKECYNKNFQYLKTNFLQNLDLNPPGLYSGAAGIALAITEGLESNLLPYSSENIFFIRNCFEQQTTILNYSAGLAGQGLSILSCRRILTVEFINTRLDAIVSQILSNQQENGCWFTIEDLNSNSKISPIGLGEGVSGIILFLLMYLKEYKNESVYHSVIKGLDWLEKKYYKDKNNIRWDITKFKNQRPTWIHDGYIGIALVFITAYEVIQESKYQKLAEEILHKVPANIQLRNLNYSWGICGLGHVYLQAYKTFKNAEWLNRTTWLVSLFMHICKKNKSGVWYWLTDEVSSVVTSDFMTGNSSIIHLFLRYYDLKGVPYPFMPE